MIRYRTREILYRQFASKVCHTVPFDILAYLMIRYAYRYVKFQKQPDLTGTTKEEACL